MGHKDLKFCQHNLKSGDVKRGHDGKYFCIMDICFLSFWNPCQLENVGRVNENN